MRLVVFELFEEAHELSEGNAYTAVIEITEQDM